MLTLLWGLMDEEPMMAVAAALQQTGAELALVDQRDVLKSDIQLVVGERISGRVCSPAGEFNLCDVESAYIRPYDCRSLASVRGTRSRSAKERSHAMDDILLTWCDITPALVLSRPSSAATNNSKPYQADFIRNAGFRVPATLLTTTPEAVTNFRHRCGRIIYKSISGVRSRVSEFSDNHSERLPNVTFCPTQFQKMIEGRDYRVHVVGDQVFACELISDAQDYRYPGDQGLEIKATSLPPEIEERCVFLARSLELSLAGIDLRRTEDDEWYCFEANPSPAFTFYQDCTGQPIAAAIASLLMNSTSMTSVAAPAEIAKQWQVDDDISPETPDYA